MIAKSKIVGLVLSICLSVALAIGSVLIYKAFSPNVFGAPEGYCEIIISPSNGGYLLSTFDGNDTFSNQYYNGDTYGYGAGLQNHRLTAIPYEGYSFSHWGTGQTESSMLYPEIRQSYSGDYDCAIYCYFVSGSPVEVETNDSTLGTVTGGGVFDEGESVTITATPTNIGYFSHWQDESGNSVSTSSTYTFTVSGSATYTAVFKAKS